MLYSPGMLSARLLLVPLLGLASSALAARKPSLAVTGLDSPPYLSGLADEIAKLAVQAAGRHRRVLGPEQVRAKLGEDALGKLAACPRDDAACRAAILAPLDVDEALGGSLNESENAYVVDVWLIDVPSKKLVNRLTRSILIASRRLQKDMAEALPKLLAGHTEGDGELVLHTKPPATQVTVDDVPLGGGAEIHRTLQPGKHHVVIEAEGYLTTERWISIAPDQTVRLDEQLVPTSGHIAEEEQAPAGATKATAASHGGFRLPWGTWLALGVSAAALGTGLYFGVTAGNVDHKAGVNVDGNGVDQGLTRAQAVQGGTDAAVANYLYVGAGVALVAAIVVAVVSPQPAASSPAVPAAGPATLRWSFP